MLRNMENLIYGNNELLSNETTSLLATTTSNNSPVSVTSSLSSSTRNNNNNNNNNGRINNNNQISDTTTTTRRTTYYGTTTTTTSATEEGVETIVDADEEDQQQEISFSRTTEDHESSSSSGDDDDDDENNEGRNSNNPTNTTATSEEAGNDEDGSSTTEGEEETRDGAIGTLTRRLRCLFSTITWPIVPLGTIVALALLWVLYAASSSDLKRSCSHPLHWYALASLILVAYIPHHAQVRSHLFHYSRERDGPIRPARVRMYDQFFHTVCLLYVYTGVTLIQTCKEDIVTATTTGTTTTATTTPPTPTMGTGETDNITTGDDLMQQQQQQQELNLLGGDDAMNTCEATCPNLYQALSVYVATLEMFTFALILPLLFLPCIYLWFLRRATAEAEAFAQLQDRLQEDETFLSNGGVTANEILDSLENVKLVSRRSGSGDGENGGAADAGGGGGGGGIGERQVWLLPTSATDASIGMNSNVKECCICMSEFLIQDETDLEDGLGDAENPAADNDALNRNSSSEEEESSSSSSSSSTEHDGHVGPTYKGIVRTRCGHIFHKECLSGWVGGRWQLNAQGGNNNNHDDDGDNRRRRARQTQCPLCREDLRPPVSSSSS